MQPRGHAGVVVTNGRQGRTRHAAAVLDAARAHVAVTDTTVGERHRSVAPTARCAPADDARRCRDIAIGGAATSARRLIAVRTMLDRTVVAVAWAAPLRGTHRTASHRRARADGHRGTRRNRRTRGPLGARRPVSRRPRGPDSERSPARGLATLRRRANRVRETCGA